MALVLLGTLTLGLPSTEVKVATAAQHAELMQVLDDRLVATADVPGGVQMGLGVCCGWQLLSHRNAAVTSGNSNVKSVSGSSRSSTVALGGNGRKPLGGGMRPSSSRNSMAEDLLTLRNASNFPAELLFTDPEAYREVEITFPRPRCVHAVSFMTTGDDRQFDPLCWEIDGSIDGKTWMRLQTQSCEFDTPAVRRRPINTFFVTEPWCKAPSTAAPSSRVDLQKIPAAVSERLCFFASSLRAILKQGGAGVRAGRGTLLDREIGGVVPVYEEQVILTEEFLCASDGRNTNLGFVISQDAWLRLAELLFHVVPPTGIAEDHWEIFARKQGMAPRELYNSYTLGELHEWLRQAELEQATGIQRCCDVRVVSWLCFQDLERAKEVRDLMLEVRLWASQRSQLLDLNGRCRKRWEEGRLLAESFDVAALPMMVLLGTACVWLVGPILFCDDLSEFWCFVIGTSNAESASNKKRKGKVLSRGQYGTLLVAFILTFQAMQVAEKADAVVDPAPVWEDAIVEYFYLNFMSYQWHLYVSIMLLLTNLAVQLCVALLEMLGGLQSWWLLGSKLRGGCCRLRRRALAPWQLVDAYCCQVDRPEYKPPGNDHDPPTARHSQQLGSS
eukprot:Skav212068  [mRNA]  locus=scaffold867:31549:44560:+ [translate_table: standard]